MHLTWNRQETAHLSEDVSFSLFPGKKNLWPRDSDLDIYIHSYLDLTYTREGFTLQFSQLNPSLNPFHEGSLNCSAYFLSWNKTKIPYNPYYPHPQKTAPRKSSLYTLHFACSLQRPCTQIHIDTKRHSQEERGLFKGIKFFFFCVVLGSLVGISPSLSIVVWSLS